MFTLLLAAAITISNEVFTFTLGEDARAKSLKVNATGEELLRPDESVPFFASFQKRPWHNEIKLIHPMKRTTFKARKVEKVGGGGGEGEGGDVVVSFELVPYKAVVTVKVKPKYIAFKLKEWLVTPADYGNQRQDLPPVEEFFLAQLPVKNKTNFGKWLGTMWDETAAVGVIAANVYALIDSQERDGYRVLQASAHHEVKMEGTEAVLIAAPGKQAYLDAVEAVEIDYGLPRGVAMRREGKVGGCKMSAQDITPVNVDWHIAQAKKAGIKRMTIYYPALFKDKGGYNYLGNYEWKESYPNKEADLKAILNRIKAAGIVPGFHVLQTHIGNRSRYITPRVDPRMRVTRHYTLMKAIDEKTDGEIEVAENPCLAARQQDLRYLKFGEELLFYEGVTTEPPYRFTGVKRGAFGTIAAPHERCEIGGTLDLSEFLAHSSYLKQNSTLADEIAEKLAAVYDLGFEYFYFDGSEGVDEPFEFFVPLSQYRVWKKCKTPPRFAGGAAKSHFGWHLLAGSNAFDAFPDKEKKAMTLKWPVEGAKTLARDFTCVNFGWIRQKPFKSAEEPGTQPDMVEYSISRAVAWDCPDQINMNEKLARELPVMDLNLEVIRRWEEVREKGWLTPEWKAHLRECKGDHHLYLNERGEYELYEAEMLPKDPQDPTLRGYRFIRQSKPKIVSWHTDRLDPAGTKPAGNKPF